jgi:DNA repair exonuclease SbcCD ATPase subunit
MKSKFLILFLFFANNLQAQDNQGISSRLQQLTEERQRLYNNWKEAANQSSGLFGSKSKDDLKVEIDDLQKVINQDNNILDELENLRRKEKEQIQSQYNDLTNQYNDLKTENEELKKRIAEHQSWSKENHSLLQQTEGKQLLFLSLFAVTAVVCVFLLIKYIAMSRELRAMSQFNKNS